MNCIESLLEHAISHVPFHRRRAPLSPLDLAQWPLMCKEDLASYALGYSEDLLSELRQPGGYIVGSGGTTANPKYIYYTHEEFAKLCKNSSDCFMANGMAAGDRVVNYVTAGDMWSSFIMVDKALGILPVTIFPLSYSSRKDHAVQIFETFQPNVVIGVSSMILELARYTASHSPKIRVQKIFYGGEPMPSGSMDLLTSIWGCEHIRSAGYGSTDIGMIGGQCIHCEPGEHYPFDDSLVEIVDGEIVVTSLFRRAMPIIRYRTGDRGAWVDAPACDCASGAPRFKLLGRLDNILIIWGCQIRYEDLVDTLQASNLEFMAVQAHIGEGEGAHVLSIRFESHLAQLGEVLVGQLRNCFYSACVDIQGIVSREMLDNVLFFQPLPAGSLETNPRTGKVVPIIDSRL